MTIDPATVTGERIHHMQEYISVEILHTLIDQSPSNELDILQAVGAAFASGIEHGILLAQRQPDAAAAVIDHTIECAGRRYGSTAECTKEVMDAHHADIVTLLTSDPPPTPPPFSFSNN